MNLRDFKSAKDRREALEKELKVNLKNISQFSLDESVASTRNCENMIGATQIPLGIAGPLKIINLKSEILNLYLPLATTEGALVASVNRGCKAITESGGCIVDSYRVGVTRGPVFKVTGLIENDTLNTFFEERFGDLQKIARETSGHLTLTKFFSRGFGKYRYVRFVFDTKDAMGMNMATIATAALVSYINEKTGAECLSIAGNFDVDKKPSWLNFIEGRGCKAWAEVILLSSVLRAVLKTTAAEMYDTWLAKCMLGSAMSGSMGFNAQYANVVAALFLATGQDPAHVVEGSLGVTTCEATSSSFRLEFAPYSHAGSRNPASKKWIPGHLPASALHRQLQAGARDDSLYISIYLPDLMIGTVGGGTGLATQKEALSLLGVAGGNDGKNAQRFAEIIGGAVLAGEISLLASLSAGTLAQSHEKLARGKQ